MSHTAAVGLAEQRTQHGFVNGSTSSASSVGYRDMVARTLWAQARGTISRCSSASSSTTTSSSQHSRRASPRRSTTLVRSGSLHCEIFTAGPTDMSFGSPRCASTRGLENIWSFSPSIVSNGRQSRAIGTGWEACSYASSKDSSECVWRTLQSAPGRVAPRVAHT
jgi:hypothetical protein